MAPFGEFCSQTFCFWWNMFLPAFESTNQQTG